MRPTCLGYLAPDQILTEYGASPLVDRYGNQL